MRWALDPADPVMLLAVLKHELCAIGRESSELRNRVSRLERDTLRGPRLNKTLLDLATRAAKGRRRRDGEPLSADAGHTNADDRGWIARPDPEGARLVTDLADLVAPFAATVSAGLIDGAAAAVACAELAQRLAAGLAIRPPASASGPADPEPWPNSSSSNFSELCMEMGPVDRALWPDFAESVAASMTAASETPEHPRLAIWGPLEARLQRRDRMILAGLNEGAWPKAAPADAFLNRSLRKRIGLPDPDERIGLSAHDFAQMANAPEVFLLRARRVDDKPAVASRWLWRLRTLAAGGLGDKDRGRSRAETGRRHGRARLGARAAAR